MFFSKRSSGLKTASDEKQAGSKHFPDEPQFQKDSEFAVLNCTTIEFNGAGLYEEKAKQLLVSHIIGYLLPSNVRS